MRGEGFIMQVAKGLDREKGGGEREEFETRREEKEF